MYRKLRNIPNNFDLKIQFMKKKESIIWYFQQIIDLNMHHLRACNRKINCVNVKGYLFLSGKFLKQKKLLEWNGWLEEMEWKWWNGGKMDGYETREQNFVCHTYHVCKSAKIFYHKMNINKYDDNFFSFLNPGVVSHSFCISFLACFFIQSRIVFRFILTCIL